MKLNFLITTDKTRYADGLTARLRAAGLALRGTNDSSQFLPMISSRGFSRISQPFRLIREIFPLLSSTSRMTPATSRYFWIWFFSRSMALAFLICSVLERSSMAFLASPLENCISAMKSSSCFTARSRAFFKVSFSALSAERSCGIRRGSVCPVFSGGVVLFSIFYSSSGIRFRQICYPLY